MKRIERLNHLADRVSDGDALAACELQEAIESQMARIVRRALRPGTADSAIVRLVRDHLGDRVDPDEEETPETEAYLAREVCDSLISELRYGPARQNFACETVMA